MAKNNRGFASMDENKQREIASMGDQASDGNFKNDPGRASKAGKKGSEAQSTEAKQRGGHNSHRS